MTRHALAALLFGLCSIGIAVAAEPAGTWKWKTKRGEKEFEQTLKLEVKDGKVTGTITGGRGGGTETKIEEGTFKDGVLSFTVTRERGDMKFVTKYNGKVSDDAIKGTITSDRGGKENKQEWEAKREKAKD